MNQTSSAPTATTLSSGTDFTDLLTSVHLIWIAIFAAVIVAGIIYGSRLRARRTAAERQVVEHAEQAAAEDEKLPAPLAPPAAPGALLPATGDAAGGPVTQLKGLGPKVAVRLAELGVTSVGQLAALDDDAARALDAQLGGFSGRMERDRWIEQARFLAAGDVKGFEAVFGRL